MTCTFGRPTCSPVSPCYGCHVRAQQTARTKAEKVAKILEVPLCACCEKPIVPGHGRSRTICRVCYLRAAQRLQRAAIDVGPLSNEELCQWAREDSGKAELSFKNGTVLEFRPPAEPFDEGEIQVVGP